MIAFRRRAPLFAPVVSSTAVGNMSVLAIRPRVARSSSGSSFQLTWRDDEPSETSRRQGCVGASRAFHVRTGRVHMPKCHTHSLSHDRHDVTISPFGARHAYSRFRTHGTASRSPRSASRNSAAGALVQRVPVIRRVRRFLRGRSAVRPLSLPAACCSPSLHSATWPAATATRALSSPEIQPSPATT